MLWSLQLVKNGVNCHLRVTFSNKIRNSHLSSSSNHFPTNKSSTRIFIFPALSLLKILILVQAFWDSELVESDDRWKQVERTFNLFHLLGLDENLLQIINRYFLFSSIYFNKIKAALVNVELLYCTIEPCIKLNITYIHRVFILKRAGEGLHPNKLNNINLSHPTNKKQGFYQISLFNIILRICVV